MHHPPHPQSYDNHTHPPTRPQEPFQAINTMFRKHVLPLQRQCIVPKKHAHPHRTYTPTPTPNPYLLQLDKVISSYNQPPCSLMNPLMHLL
jgi:hypothetical protein